eukprot:jgi/Ulvmu1/901/UM101_0009.1
MWRWGIVQRVHGPVRARRRFKHTKNNVLFHYMRLAFGKRGSLVPCWLLLVPGVTDGVQSVMSLARCDASDTDHVPSREDSLNSYHAVLDQRIGASQPVLRSVRGPFPDVATVQTQAFPPSVADTSSPVALDEFNLIRHIPDASLEQDEVPAVGYTAGARRAESALASGRQRIDCGAPDPLFTPTGSVIDSHGSTDLRDTIEEDELYRSLADNEGAVVPYGITLERYLALVIFKYGGGDWNIVDARHVCAHISGPNRLAPLLWRYARVAPRPPAYSTNAALQRLPHSANQICRSALLSPTSRPITQTHPDDSGLMPRDRNLYLEAAWNQSRLNTNRAVIPHGLYETADTVSQLHGRSHQVTDEGAVERSAAEAPSDPGHHSTDSLLWNQLTDQSWRELTASPAARPICRSGSGSGGAMRGEPDWQYTQRMRDATAAVASDEHSAHNNSDCGESDDSISGSDSGLARDILFWNSHPPQQVLFARGAYVTDADVSSSGCDSHPSDGRARSMRSMTLPGVCSPSGHSTSSRSTASLCELEGVLQHMGDGGGVDELHEWGVHDLHACRNQDSPGSGSFAHGHCSPCPDAGAGSPCMTNAACGPGHDVDSTLGGPAAGAAQTVSSGGCCSMRGSGEAGSSMLCDAGSRAPRPAPCGPASSMSAAELADRVPQAAMAIPGRRQHGSHVISRSTGVHSNQSSTDGRQPQWPPDSSPQADVPQDTGGDCGGCGGGPEHCYRSMRSTRQSARQSIRSERDSEASSQGMASDRSCTLEATSPRCHSRSGCDIFEGQHGAPVLCGAAPNLPLRRVHSAPPPFREPSSCGSDGSGRGFMHEGPEAHDSAAPAAAPAHSRGRPPSSSQQGWPFRAVHAMVGARDIAAAMLPAQAAEHGHDSMSPPPSAAPPLAGQHSFSSSTVHQDHMDGAEHLTRFYSDVLAKMSHPRARALMLQTLNFFPAAPSSSGTAELDHAGPRCAGWLSSSRGSTRCLFAGRRLSGDRAECSRHGAATPCGSQDWGSGARDRVTVESLRATRSAGPLFAVSSSSEPGNGTSSSLGNVEGICPSLQGGASGVEAHAADAEKAGRRSTACFDPPASSANQHVGCALYPACEPPLGGGGGRSETGQAGVSASTEASELGECVHNHHDCGRERQATLLLGEAGGIGEAVTAGVAAGCAGGTDVPAGASCTAERPEAAEAYPGAHASTADGDGHDAATTSWVVGANTSWAEYPDASGGAPGPPSDEQPAVASFFTAHAHLSGLRGAAGRGGGDAGLHLQATAADAAATNAGACMHNHACILPHSTACTSEDALRAPNAAATGHAVSEAHSTARSASARTRGTESHMLNMPQRLLCSAESAAARQTYASNLDDAGCPQGMTESSSSRSPLSGQHTPCRALLPSAKGARSLAGSSRSGGASCEGGLNGACCQKNFPASHEPGPRCSSGAVAAACAAKGMLGAVTPAAVATPPSSPVTATPDGSVSGEGHLHSAAVVAAATATSSSITLQMRAPGMHGAPGRGVPRLHDRSPLPRRKPRRGGGQRTALIRLEPRRSALPCPLQREGGSLGRHSRTVVRLGSTVLRGAERAHSSAGIGGGSPGSDCTRIVLQQKVPHEGAQRREPRLKVLMRPA